MQYLFACILHYIASPRNSYLYHVYLLQFEKQFLPALKNNVEMVTNIYSVLLQTSTFQRENSFVTVQPKHTAKEGEGAGGNLAEDLFGVFFPIIFLRELNIGKSILLDSNTACW